MIEIEIGIAIEIENNMGLGHAKLDVYRQNLKPKT